MLRKLLATCVLSLLAVTAFATPSPVTVTGTLQTATAAGLQGNAFVRFRLRNFSGFVPRVVGTGIVAGVQVDAQPDSAGNVSTTIWANDDITPNTCGVAHNQACTWYTIEFWNDGRITSSGNYCIPNSSPTYNLNSATPCLTPPLPPPPANVGGGSGSITNFSSGNLSPLFTTSVSSPTTTPVQSFTLTQAPANTVFGNFSSSTATPSYQSLTFTGNTTVLASSTGTLTAGDTVSIDSNGNFIDSGVTTSTVSTCPTGVGANAYYPSSAAVINCDLSLVDDGSGQLTGNKFVTRGTNGGITGTEGTGANLTSAAGFDLLWADITAHRWKVNNNGGSTTTLAQFTDKLSVFAATSSAELGGVISDETGTGLVVFNNGPTFIAPVLGAASGTSLSLSGQFTSTLSTGTAPFAVTSTTPVTNLTVSNHPKVFACGTTTTCSATAQTGGLVVQGQVTLTAGTATVTALPAFTSTTSYRCTASDRTAIATGANAVPASTTSLTVTGTGTDVIDFICTGN